MSWKAREFQVRLSDHTKPTGKSTLPSLPISHLYRSLHTYLLQQIPDNCDTRLANLIYLMMGTFQAKSVQ